MSRMTVTTVKCRHCGATFRFPDLPPEARSQVAAIVRAGRLTYAAAILNNLTWDLRPRSPWWLTIIPEQNPLEPLDTVNVIKHFTDPPGVCRNCQTPVTNAGFSECPNCHAINVDW